jgi:hypothetical protein
MKKFHIIRKKQHNNNNFRIHLIGGFKNDIALYRKEDKWTQDDGNEKEENEVSTNNPSNNQPEMEYQALYWKMTIVGTTTVKKMKLNMKLKIQTISKAFRKRISTL